MNFSTIKIMQHSCKSFKSNTISQTNKHKKQIIGQHILKVRQVGISIIIIIIMYYLFCFM